MTVSKYTFIESHIEVSEFVLVYPLTRWNAPMPNVGPQKLRGVHVGVTTWYWARNGETNRRVKGRSMPVLNELGRPDRESIITAVQAALREAIG
jgi:hypothetical protein